MMKLIVFVEEFFNKIQVATEDVILLFLRLYVAQDIFKSGWTKLSQWEATLMIFEYSTMPIIHYQLMAVVGTFLEIVLSILVFIGLLARPAALLLMVNMGILLVSIAMLREDGFYNPIEVGLILLMIVLYGSGKISLQFLIIQRAHKRLFR